MSAIGIKMDNQWMKLHVRWNCRVLQVKQQSFGMEVPEDLEKGVFVVSKLKVPAVSILYAESHDITVEGSLQNKNTPELPYTNFYIESDGLFFQVALISACVEECNRFMAERGDTAVICTDNVGRHYIASIKPNDIKKV